MMSPELRRAAALLQIQDRGRAITTIYYGGVVSQSWQYHLASSAMFRE